MTLSVQIKVFVDNWQDYHSANNNAVNTVVGNVKVLANLQSPELGNSRDILVYLPPTYETGSQKYPVLYTHDGQNLFDETTSFSGEWHVDETMEELSQEGIEAIIVGIPNAGAERMDEYSPFLDEKYGGGRGDDYLAFIIQTLKPIIETDFRVKIGPQNTGLLGSSMGGFISLYGFFRHPEIFGLAGIMSPSIWFANGAIFRFMAQTPFVGGRIYMDVGTRELGSGRKISNVLKSRRYYATVRRMHRLLVKKGYRPHRDLLYIEEKWAHHEEIAWARRLPPAIRFLLDRPSGSV